MLPRPGSDSTSMRPPCASMSDQRIVNRNLAKSPGLAPVRLKKSLPAAEHRSAYTAGAMRRKMPCQSRRQFIGGSFTLATLSLLSGCGILPSQMQQPSKVPRLGWVMPNSLDSAVDVDITRGFQQGLRE